MIYRIFSDHADTERTITTQEELRNVLPTTPGIAIHMLETPDANYQIDYGSPDRDHVTVKVFTAYGVDRNVYDNQVAANAAFLALTAKVLS